MPTPHPLSPRVEAQSGRLIALMTAVYEDAMLAETASQHSDPKSRAWRHAADRIRQWNDDTITRSVALLVVQDKFPHVPWAVLGDRADLWDMAQQLDGAFRDIGFKRSEAVFLRRAWLRRENALGSPSWENTVAIVQADQPASRLRSALRQLGKQNVPFAGEVLPSSVVSDPYLQLQMAAPAPGNREPNASVALIYGRKLQLVTAPA